MNLKPGEFTKYAAIFLFANDEEGLDAFCKGAGLDKEALLPLLGRAARVAPELLRGVGAAARGARGTARTLGSVKGLKVTPEVLAAARRGRGAAAFRRAGAAAAAPGVVGPGVAPQLAAGRALGAGGLPGAARAGGRAPGAIRARMRAAAPAPAPTVAAAPAPAPVAAARKPTITPGKAPKRQRPTITPGKAPAPAPGLAGSPFVWPAIAGAGGLALGGALNRR